MTVRHGTLTGYTRDGCHCQACRDANTRWAKNRRLRQAEGTWRPFAPVEEALDLVRQLRTAGLSSASIAHASGLPSGLVTRLVWDSALRPKRVRTATITALHRALRTPNIPDGALVDATGTRRRIEALAVQGWSIAWVAQRLGCTTTHIAAMRRRARVTKRNADRISALYDEVSMRVGPSRAQHRRRAVRLGWAPPLAWDDDTIDDPAAAPNTGTVLRHANGTPVGLDLDDVEHLLSVGCSLHEVAARMGVTEGGIAKAAYRAGRADLGARFTAARQRDWSVAS